MAQNEYLVYRSQRIFNFTSEFSKADLKRRHKQFVQEFHPDAAAGRGEDTGLYELRMKDVNEARDCLSVRFERKRTIAQCVPRPSDWLEHSESQGDWWSAYWGLESECATQDQDGIGKTLPSSVEKPPRPHQKSAACLGIASVLRRFVNLLDNHRIMVRIVFFAAALLLYCAFGSSVIIASGFNFLALISSPTIASLAILLLLSLINLIVPIATAPILFVVKKICCFVAALLD